MQSKLITLIVLSIPFICFIELIDAAKLKSIPARNNDDDAHYQADYEIQLNKSNGKLFIAYIIEEGDLFVKKTCKCISSTKCKAKNTVKLSKYVKFISLL